MEKKLSSKDLSSMTLNPNATETYAISIDRTPNPVI
jgi:hypothetical protein